MGPRRQGGDALVSKGGNLRRKSKGTLIVLMRPCRKGPRVFVVKANGSSSLVRCLCIQKTKGVDLSGNQTRAPPNQFALSPRLDR